jgi:ribonuclease PH
MPRSDGRQADELRKIDFIIDVAPHAAGSVLIAFGNTRVICAASIQEDVPRWMKVQNVKGGWLTAEYSMLPYSTLDRKDRESSRGRPDGRSTEIQRLIGRSLRAVVDLEKLGPRTLNIDCDVLQADGGTRTASITGPCPLGPCFPLPKNSSNSASRRHRIPPADEGTRPRRKVRR